MRNFIGVPAKWASAADAAEALKGVLHHDYSMLLGAICFFEMGAWGDVGLHLGDGEILRLVGGDPMIRNIHLDGAVFLGWVSQYEFRRATELDE
jgi:hypothetical protein